MDNNTNNNQKEEKKTSNRFKQAAERQKVAPGGPGVLPSQEQLNQPLSFTQPTQENPGLIIPEPKEEPIDIASILQNRYAEGRYTRNEEETKSKTYQGLLKPSINDRIMKDVSKKKIKSRNDLINFLLEEYYGLHDEQK